MYCCYIVWRSRFLKICHAPATLLNIIIIQYIIELLLGIDQIFIKIQLENPDLQTSEPEFDFFLFFRIGDEINYP